MPGKVLCFEDSPAFQKVLSLVLKSRGYEIVMAGDGVEGMYEGCMKGVNSL